MGLKAKVSRGRLLVDRPTTLREGSVVELVLDDEGDQLDDDDRAALSSAISTSLDEHARGLAVPAAQILGRLRTRSSS